jgi:hypothetical protein
MAQDLQDSLLSSKIINHQKNNSNLQEFIMEQFSLLSFLIKKKLKTLDIICIYPQKGKVLSEINRNQLLNLKNFSKN